MPAQVARIARLAPLAMFLLLSLFSTLGCGRRQAPPSEAPAHVTTVASDVASGTALDPAWPFAITRYQDLVVDQALYGTFDPATGVHTCADESRDSFVLAGGELRSFSVTVTAPSELLLGGCVEGVAAGSPAELLLRVRLPSGESREERFALGSEAGTSEVAAWRASRFALEGVPAGSSLRLDLTAVLPAGARAFVDTLAVKSTRAVGPLPSARRVVLISLDAFREDAIGDLGRRTETPVLNRLLAVSQRFTPSWSQEISTKTSHASMLTGLPVDLHGVDREERPLPPAVATLAERLASTGAATGAFLQTAPFFAEKFGLNQGFATYRLKAWTVEQELRLATDWASVHRDESSFLFVHLYGAHSDFGVLPYEANGVTRASVATRFGVGDYGCAGEACASRRLLAINYKALAPLPQEGEIARWLYERGVETLDRQLGQFFDDLRRAGLWDDALIVLTGDHGEAFGEHGYFLHTTPHEETLRVPLVVKWPESANRAGLVTPRFSTALDIAPTVLAHFGLPTDDLPGHDLAQPPGRGARLMLSKDAVRLDDLKLVLATKEFPRALYDLARDPGEQTNLLPGRETDASRLEEIRRLALAAAARRMKAPPPETTELQPFTSEEIERLRSLGYL